MKNIYLIGMMGSGKTSTARELGVLLQMPILDLDAELERQTGRSIAEIFREKGEPWFRETETSVLIEGKAAEGTVIATGGGIILARQNRDWMRAHGEVIFLETSLENLWQRVSLEKGRPLIEGKNPKENLMTIAKARLPLYEECAHFKIETDGKTPREVARLIQEQLKLRSAS